MINNIRKNQEIWDLIAKSFDKTRQKPWKQCIDFIKNLEKPNLVVDIGCGNGRHLVICAEYCKKAIGLDLSKELLIIAKEKLEEKKLKNAIFLHSDAKYIPLKNETVDAVLYIASLHNIQGRQNRIQSLKELKRILKKEGTALISVWSRWQDKYRKLFLKNRLLQKGELEFGDIDIYWKQHSLNVPRFYHLYSKKELIEDIKKAGFTIREIKSVKLHSKKFPDNFFAIVKKNKFFNKY